jgi:hypothetical protein
MFTAERQRAQPYLDKVTGQLIEQWYLLHHRKVRIVTNQRKLAEEVRHFLYYAEFLAENMYNSAADLPIAIPEDLLWQVGERLYRPVALTCYLFQTQPGESFPPAPAQPKPEDIEWIEITGVDGPLRARWKDNCVTANTNRTRMYQAGSVRCCIKRIRLLKKTIAEFYMEGKDRKPHPIGCQFATI